MSLSSKRQLPNVDLEPTEKIRHLNTALIVKTEDQIISFVLSFVNLEHGK